MHGLQAGDDLTVIALWLGHANPAITHMYIEADLIAKERALCTPRSPNDKPRIIPASVMPTFS
ncbi:integrase [Paraburkholderia sp. CNPSo 3157]|uniref:Integrase n=1 Tax=Paraburkholderia franconis TaxID=2654983 RepID=A0A7X1TJD1_9BURK|nr:integrase [Paraburkholderia franconis]